MTLRDKIHAKAHALATGYGLGKNKFYERLISAISIPCAFVIHDTLNSHYKSVIFLTFIITLVGFILHYIAACHIEKEEYNHLVIHHLIGVFLMSLGIPFKIKLVTFGFIVFHIASLTNIRLGNPLTKNIPHICEKTKFFLTDIIWGIGMNVFLRLIIWVVI